MYFRFGWFLLGVNVVVIIWNLYFLFFQGYWINGVAALFLLLVSRLMLSSLLKDW
jgi:hypothetical protein